MCIFRGSNYHLHICFPSQKGFTLKEKNLLLLEQRKPKFGRAISAREANRMSQKLFPLVTGAQHSDANARLQLLLENSKSKTGVNYVKQIFRITSPTGMGYPFDSKQQVLSFK